MQIAPVCSYPVLDRFGLDPHFVSLRGRRQLEYERSPDPLTQWCRLDANGDALRGKDLRSIDYGLE
jgi:hypothetical protein